LGHKTMTARAPTAAAVQVQLSDSQNGRGALHIFVLHSARNE